MLGRPFINCVCYSSLILRVCSPIAGAVAQRLRQHQLIVVLVVVVMALVVVVMVVVVAAVNSRVHTS